MYEHIFAAATLRLNESIALRWIEPLHSSGSHAGLLVESNSNRVVRSVGNSKLPPILVALTRHATPDRDLVKNTARRDVVRTRRLHTIPT